MRPGTLQKLEIEVEMAGHVPGTQKYEVVLTARKVEKCMEMHDVLSCEECVAFEDCELLRLYLRDLRFGLRKDEPVAGGSDAVGGSSPVDGAGTGSG